MKSFSSSSYASDDTATLALARAAVAKDPQALFTDFQWFLYEGRDTVFYSAFSTQSFDKDQVDNMLR